MARFAVGGLIAMAGLLGAAAPAQAAITLGDISGGGNQSCSVANSPNVNTSAPYVVPSAGVITAWSNKARSGLGQQLRFKVYRGNPAPPNFRTVGESPLTDIAQSTENTFNTRIPVAAGDFIGLTTGPNSANAAPDCFFATNNQSDTYFERIPAQETPTGATATFNPFPGNRVNVAARLEPDRDCDGFGDETQDTSIGTCGGGGGGGGPGPGTGGDTTKPRMIKAKAKAAANRRSVSISITPNENCTLRAGATVGLGGRKKIRLTSVKRTGRAGRATKLTLKVRRKDRGRLRRALRRKGRTAKIAIRATDAAGNTARTTASAKLKRL